MRHDWVSPVDGDTKIADGQFPIEVWPDATVIVDSSLELNHAVRSPNAMRIYDSWQQSQVRRLMIYVERGLFLAGVLSVCIQVTSQVHSLILSGDAILEPRERGGPTRGASSAQEETAEESGPDFSLWGKSRIQAYRDSLTLKVEPPIALLKIPRFHLSVPVFDGTDEITLNRGLGRIAGTAVPGQAGNLAIAGHRDGFFRSLKDIAPGDVIEIVRQSGTDVYSVATTKIVDPHDVTVLEPAEETTLTLVTCYPFYFVGDAPLRFIVQSKLARESQEEVTRVSWSEPSQTEKLK